MRRLFEIVPGLYCLPRSLSAWSYFALDGDQVTIVDAGMRGGGVAVLAALHQLQRSPEEVEYLIATHCHLDHVGGFARLRAVSTGRVAVHEAEARLLEGGEDAPNPFQVRALGWLASPALSLLMPQPVPVDQELQGGDRLPVLGGMEVIHTPGHTPGSISLYFPHHGVLLVGDALQYRFGRLSGPSSVFSTDMEEARRSIRRLAGRDIDIIGFSHFPPMRHGAGPALRRLAERCA